MEEILQKKLKIWIIASINLLVAFFIGLVILLLLFGVIIIPLLMILDYYILQILLKDKGVLIPKKKRSIWLMLVINLSFAFVIGVTINYMKSIVKYNMALVMLPLLIILNYIIIDRYHYYLRHSDDKEENSDENVKEQEEKGISVIEYEGKKYIFSIKSIIVLAIGAPISAYIIYLFFDHEMNFWLHEIVVKQTIFLLNLLFGMNAKPIYAPIGIYHWGFRIPNRGLIGFGTFCTGVQAICVFAGIIIFTPHSQDPKTREDVVWRKTKSFIVSSIIFYLVNILRMIIQIYLFHIGYAWDDIHYSISAASSFIAAIIMLLLHVWIPEFIISIIYTGTLVGKKIKKKDETEEEEGK